MQKPIKIIDLFAGPGGLGEGFSACRESAASALFKIGLSIENDPHAHGTLTLRSFYRQFSADQLPAAYMDYLAGHLGTHPEDGLLRLTQYQKQAEAARSEARLLTLGKDTRAINAAIAGVLGNRPAPWVLIGGPPCQAYSLVGRARNKGVVDYKPEKDHRNYLYKEYLKVLARFSPDVFVMENVKGMLSAKVAGRNMFAQILKDLECPARALRTKDKRVEYETIALGLNSGNLDLFGKANPSDYVIRSERYGIPQSRHRVIILGIRTDRIDRGKLQPLSSAPSPTIEDVIRDLPSCRSGLSKETDNLQSWIASISSGAHRTAKAVADNGNQDVANQILAAAEKISQSALDRGSNWAVAKRRSFSDRLPLELQNWYSNFGRTNIVVNHDTRGHRADDLQRYLFCSSFSNTRQSAGKCTPKRGDFPELLYPDHKSWEHGVFADRFRVQARRKTATTITSHIAKDGHYFIHYDPLQCRSLTVREAARVQTFPDDYFFVGPRTEQYKQVGNAVPPYLAKQLAEVVFKLICR